MVICCQLHFLIEFRSAGVGENVDNCIPNLVILQRFLEPPYHLVLEILSLSIQVSNFYVSVASPSTATTSFVLPAFVIVNYMGRANRRSVISLTSLSTLISYFILH